MTNSVEVDPAELARARTETINLVQWLARIANSYVGDGAAEQRTDLEFRAADAAFITRRFGAGLALEMRLPGLEMQFLENGKPMPHIFDPEEHSPAEVEAWLLVELLHRGVDCDKFSKALPYEIAGLMTGDAEDHSPRSCQQGLRQLMMLFQRAVAVLESAARAVGAKTVHILCAPQTLTFRCASEPAGKQNDLHFSSGDAQNPEPYFYADRAPTNGAVRNLRRPLLKGSTLLAQNDPAATARQLLELVSS
jgi:hypothetical protein